MTKLKIDYSEARDWYIKGDKEKEGIKYPSLPDIAREFEYFFYTVPHVFFKYRFSQIRV